MVDGAFNTLQKIWGLVLTAGNNGQKPAGKAESKELEKWNSELYKTRNVQLAMVNSQLSRLERTFSYNRFFPFLQLDYNLSENFNMPSYLVAISKIVKLLKVS